MGCCVSGESLPEVSSTQLNGEIEKLRKIYYEGDVKGAVVVGIDGVLLYSLGKGVGNDVVSYIDYFYTATDIGDAPSTPAVAHVQGDTTLTTITTLTPQHLLIFTLSYASQPHILCQINSADFNRPLANRAVSIALILGLTPPTPEA